MTDEKLLKSLSKLGFPMFEPSEELEKKVVALANSEMHSLARKLLE